MEWNRTSRNRSTQICPSNCWQQYAKQFNRGKRVFSTEGAGTNELKRKEKKNQLKPPILYKKWLKIDHTLNVKWKTIKLLGKNLERHLQDSGLGRVLRLVTKSTIHKTELTYWSSSN